MGIDSAGPAGLCSGGGESAPGKHKWSLLWEEATLRGPCPSESMREAQGGCQLVLKGESQDLIRREKDTHVLGNHLGLLPPLRSSCTHPQVHWLCTTVITTQEMPLKERKVHWISQSLRSWFMLTRTHCDKPVPSQSAMVGGT